MQPSKTNPIAFLPLLLLLIVTACNPQPMLWPNNGQKILATYYELPSSDTTKIVISDSLVLLPELPDSAIQKYDTILYAKPGKHARALFPGVRLHSVKKHSGQPRIEEYYTFDKDAVKLAGYTVNDTAYITTYSRPMVILPAIEDKYDSTTTVKTDRDRTSQKFTGETKMKTRVQLICNTKLSSNGTTESGFLYDLTLSSDATVGFGDNNLVVPDAIVMQSNLLFGKTRGLLYEWSLKSKPAPSQTGNPAKENTPIIYLEFITYQPIP